MTWRPLPDATGGGPRRLSSGLNLVARRMGSPPPAVLSTVFHRWSDVVGPALAARCRPLAVRDGALVVTVEEPGWATEVRFLGPSILARAEQLAGQPVAGRLEVRVRPAR
ncbi:MAG: DUF721 domain-containing protein [Acidimicrobiales bacterium]